MIIWFYHRILPKDSNAAVSIAVFEKQMRHLKESGHNFIDTSQLADFLLQNKALPEKPVMISFDDGWADNFIFATPVLAKFAIRAVLALNTGLADLESQKIRSEKEYPIKNSKEALADAAIRGDKTSFLSAAEIKTMAESGLWDIQSHGNTHLACYHSLKKIRGFYPEKKHWCMEYALGEPPFDGAPCAEFASILAYPKTIVSEELKKNLRNAKNHNERIIILRKTPASLIQIETQDQFSKRVKADLLESKRLIRQLAGTEPASFFCPWGHSSPLLRKIARECDFKLQFTTKKSALSKQSDPTIIPRIPMPQNYGDFRLAHIKYSMLQKIKFDFFSNKSNKAI